MFTGTALGAISDLPNPADKRQKHVKNLISLKLNAIRNVNCP
jgi:hypothetical protein